MADLAPVVDRLPLNKLVGDERGAFFIQKEGNRLDGSGPLHGAIGKRQVQSAFSGHDGKVDFAPRSDAAAAQLALVGMAKLARGGGTSGAANAGSVTARIAVASAARIIAANMENAPGRKFLIKTSRLLAVGKSGLDDRDSTGGRLSRFFHPL